ncbi:hypothetical protein N0A02_11655 [Paraburkholderia acidicola]|uniref:Uncharacterized protein n=1 Tax=Paraburkholderia acidicola TaxID=1912599 RepID=A0ABV1LLD7_9BURK
MKADSLLEQQAREKRNRFAYVFYGVALTCCLLFVFTARKNFQPTIWGSAFAVVSAGSLTLGFVIRVRPVVAQIWKTVFGKLLLALCSAFTAVIACLPARNIVSGAMRLPVGDFPTTLTFWTILCYPAVAIGLAVVMLFIVYTLLLVVAGLTVFSTHPSLDWVIRGTASLLPSRWTSHRRIVDSRRRVATVMLADAFGAAALSVIAAYSLTGWYRIIDQPNLVRIFAYWADYESPTEYPGAEKEALRLLENGVVSYARPKKWDVDIRVACLKGVSCPQPQTSSPVTTRR